MILWSHLLCFLAWREGLFISLPNHVYWNWPTVLLLFYFVSSQGCIPIKQNTANEPTAPSDQYNKGRQSELPLNTACLKKDRLKLFTGLQQNSAYLIPWSLYCKTTKKEQDTELEGPASITSQHLRSATAAFCTICLCKQWSRDGNSSLLASGVMKPQWGTPRTFFLLPTGSFSMGISAAPGTGRQLQHVSSTSAWQTDVLCCSAQNRLRERKS